MLKTIYLYGSPTPPPHIRSNISVPSYEKGRLFSVKIMNSICYLYLRYKYLRKYADISIDRKESHTS